MKLSVKIFFKDVLAVLIFGSVGVYFAYLLYNDINQSLNSQDGQVIGYVLEMNNQPKRKYDGRTLWAPLESDSPIYANDTLKTFENDHLAIILDDGTEIALEPNSMIRLQEDSISFNGGTISAVNRRGNSEVNIVTADGSILTLDKGSVDISQKEGEDVELRVTQGEAKLTSANGESRSLDNKESLSINKEGAVENTFQYRIILQEPHTQQYYISYNERQNVDFSWELPEGYETSQLTLSRDVSMNEAFFSQSLDKNTMSLELEPGRYFYQVQSEDAKSPVTRFTVIQDQQPVLIQPVFNAELGYRSKLPRIAFQWSSSTYADKYLLEIATDPEFSQITQRAQSEDNYFFLENLTDGEYWWRIAPHFPMNGGIWMDYSQEVKFSVFQDLTLEETTLLSPSNEALLTTLHSAEGIRFIWKADNDAATYRFRVSRDPDMKDILEEKELTDNFYYRSLPEMGTYYWNIEGKTFDNISLPSSEIRRFDVKDIQESISYIFPEPDEALEMNPLELLRFQWDSLEERFYHFRLWYRENGSLEEKLISDNISRSKSIMVVTPGDGDYRWQVAAVDEMGIVIDQGREQYFRISAPFKGPRILSPAPQSHFSLIGTPDLPLEWEALEDADFYQVSLFKKDSNEALITQSNLKETSWEIVDYSLLSKGEYSLEVQAVRISPPAGFPALSTISHQNFVLDEVSIFAPPQLNYPSDDRVLSSLDLLREDLIFQWQADPKLQQFTVNIYGSETQEIPVAQYKTDNLSITIEDLTPGIYFWDVQAQDRRGYKAPSSTRNRFRITPLPNLERPGMIFPSKNSKVDMTYRDSLEFRWENVANADYYSLALYNEEGLLVFQKSHLSETHFDLTDLKVLDIGNFFVELTAEKYISDLNLQISSLPVRIGFEITLEQEYKVPEVRSSNVQYTD